MAEHNLRVKKFAEMDLSHVPALRKLRTTAVVLLLHGSSNTLESLTTILARNSLQRTPRILDLQSIKTMFLDMFYSARDSESQVSLQLKMCAPECENP